jgi:uracil-DNA glycosylase
MTLDLDGRRRAMLAEMGLRGVALMPLPAAVEGESPGPAVAQRVEQPVSAQVVRPQAPDAAAPRVVATARNDVELMSWDELAQAVSACERCGLCRGRHHAVFGVGDREAEWLIVGEAPGEQEDLSGEPFVGAAGKLLDNMLRALGLDRRQKVYIANVLKCRPPANRNPEPGEVAHCEPFLRRQVELLKPRIILAMGRFAVQTLLGSNEPIGRLRGRVHHYQGVPVVATYHPAYLLRNLPEKAKAWADLCLAAELRRAQPD